MNRYPRRLKPAKPSKWSDAAWLRYEVLRLTAERDALIAALPERDRIVAQATVDRYKQQIAQQGADDAVRQLTERGLLRQQPAQTATVKRLQRDEQGQITGLVERVEQVEEAPASKALTAAVQAGADSVADYYVSVGMAKGYRRGLEEASRLTGGNGSKIRVEFPGWPDWTAE